MKTRMVLWLAVMAVAAGRVEAAESIGVVAVAAPPGPSPELVEMMVQLRQTVSERTAGVLDARQLRDRMAGQAPGASLAELDRAYEGARAAYVAGDYEGSVRTLRAIVEDLEKLPDSSEGFVQWERAMLRLAKAELDLGRQDEARGALERLVRASPDLKVDPALYPPKFVREVADVRAQIKKLPSRKLTVTSPNKGATVYVDGRTVGSSPVTVAVPQGRHRVAGSQDGVYAPPQIVDLAEDETVALDFAIPESLRPNLGPGLALPEEDRARRLVSAGGFLRLDTLLATTLIEQGGVAYLVGSVYDVRHGMLKREGRVRLAGQSLPLGGTTALADFLITGQAVSDLVETSGPGGKAVDLRPHAASNNIDFRSQPHPKSATKGWIAFGAGVGAVVLGGISVWQVISSNGSYADARALSPTGNPAAGDAAKYQQLLADGDSAKTRAVITGIGAGACLVTSVVLGVISARETGEVGPFRF
jgi:hypothetical protein